MTEHKIFFINNSLSDFVLIKTNASQTKSIFLIDTEASVSLIKISSISKDLAYDKTDIIKLIGITKNPVLSLGSFNLVLVEQNEFVHKFHFVSDDFSIPSNGIIGKDFMKRFKCSVNYGDMTLTMRKTDNIPIPIPIKSEIIEGVSALTSKAKNFHALLKHSKLKRM